MVDELLNKLNNAFDELKGVIEQQKNMIVSLKEEAKEANKQKAIKEAECGELRAKLAKFHNAMKGLV